MMSFLAALTLTGATGARTLSTRWAGGAAQLLTIQVSEPDQPLSGASKSDKTASQSRAEIVQADLATLPAGTQVHRLTQEELARLLTPWLGDAGKTALPLPAVIEVRLAEGHEAPADLEQTLNAHVPAPWWNIMLNGAAACAHWPRA